MGDVICESINELKQLEIHYKNNLKRIIQPHAYGLDKDGDRVLSAYQTSGFSTSGDIPNWRLFKIKNITNIRELNEHFQVKPDYNARGYSYIINMICQILA